MGDENVKESITISLELTRRKKKVKNKRERERERIGNRRMLWFNKSVVKINIILQLIYIYIYIKGVKKLLACHSSSRF